MRCGGGTCRRQVPHSDPGRIARGPRGRGERPHHQEQGHLDWLEHGHRRDPRHLIKNKAKTLEDIWNNAQYIINDKIEVGADDKKLIDDLSKKVINDFINEFEKLSSPSREILEPVIKSLIDKHKTNFKGVGQPLRIALVGSRFGPGLYDVILSLDKAEVIKRLKSV